MRATLLTQADCRSCAQAKDLLDRLAGDYALDIETVDLASPAGQRLAADGSMMFSPGTLLEGEPVLYGRPSERRLRREIERRMVRTRKLS